MGRSPKEDNGEGKWYRNWVIAVLSITREACNVAPTTEEQAAAVTCSDMQWQDHGTVSSAQLTKRLFGSDPPSPHITDYLSDLKVRLSSLRLKTECVCSPDMKREIIP